MSDGEDNALGYDGGYDNEGGYFDNDEEQLAADETGLDVTGDAGEEQEQIDGELLAAGEGYSSSTIP